MDLNEIAVFIKVVQTGSFSQAALNLEMPKSTVSHRVSALEKRLGVSLIQRTTRRLHVTPAGEAYFKRCIEGLEAIASAEAEIAAAQSEPQGLLRVTAPVEIGNSVLPPILAEAARTYAKMSVEVLLTDRRVDLLAEGVDLAIRAGQLSDSSLIVRRLGSVYFAPFASPNYVTKIHHPEQLAQYEFILFTPLAKQEWTLTNAQSSFKVAASGRLVINDLTLVKRLAVQGSGIAFLPAFYCASELKSGSLVRLLPEWRSEMNPVHFVYPAQKFMSAKLSCFMALAQDPIRAMLEA